MTSHNARTPHPGPGAASGTNHNEGNQFMSNVIPFHGTQMVAQLIDGVPNVAVRPVCDSLGIGYGSQYNRLQREPWASVSVMKTVAADGKNREMAFIDRRTFTMWLATIQTSRIKNEAAKDLLVAYQREAADALDRYFNEGGAINPNASEHQVNALLFQARAQMELCQAAKGLIQPDHLEARALAILDRATGDHARPSNPILYAQDFLKSKNLGEKRRKSVQSMFGKRLKKAYINLHGVEPGMYPLTLPNGQTRDVRAYTEADRPLMEQVWAGYFETQEALA